MRRFLAAVLLVSVCSAVSGQETAKPDADTKPAIPDLSEFKTVETATKAAIIPPLASATTGQRGYLGVSFLRDSAGKVSVGQVAEDSPAAKAGIVAGDVVVRINETIIDEIDDVQETVLAQSAGDTLQMELRRKDSPVEVSVTLAGTSRPRTINPNPASLGIRVAEAEGDAGVKIDQVIPNSPADKAKLKAGEVILKVDGTPLAGPTHLPELLAEKKPGDIALLTLLLADKAVDYKVELAAATTGFASRGGNANWDNRPSPFWKKDVYRLAMILVEFPDVKHNAKVSVSDWNQALFSEHTYVEKSPTGQAVFGSLRDYYHEQSYGKLRVEGKVFDWIEVEKKRGDYAPDSGTANKSVFLTEALDKLLAREGADVLQNFDGVTFVYAGDRPARVNRGGLYWPHRATVTYKGKRWPYFICAEGSTRMESISVYCHEFGHMLGLPDLYARPENPGSEGLGAWCAMSNQAGNGQPQHFSAWCKEQLGWITPTVIDPNVEQKLLLDAIEESPKECFKVLARPDGSEYFLLENRRRKGFDRSLPAEGLLIWRVVGNRPMLEESHGIEGPAGPGAFMRSVPFPSTSNDAFTPFTTPSSRTQLGGGHAVYLTNIRRLPDGRVTFYVGYKFL